MKKHAICILAHKNWEQLDDLIDTLGCEYADVFLHIDKKRRNDFDTYAERHDFKRHTNVCMIESYNVDWGGIRSCSWNLRCSRKCLSMVTFMTMFTLSQDKTFLLCQ